VDLEAAFDEIDTDGSGDIDVVELRASMIALGLSVTVAEAQRIADLCDTDGDGTISKPEFAALFGEQKAAVCGLGDRGSGGGGGGDRFGGFAAGGRPPSGGWVEGGRSSHPSSRGSSRGGTPDSHRGGGSNKGGGGGGGGPGSSNEDRHPCVGRVRSELRRLCEGLEDGADRMEGVFRVRRTKEP
jgi:hypothetical protein